MKTNFNPSITEPVDLPVVGPWKESRHLFDETSRLAIRASIAAGRPLLIRGECGIGKSQLARAAAVEMGASFLSFVINQRTESEDLLYHYDAVSRLAHAQVAGAYTDTPDKIVSEIAPEKFIKPGVLWWAFNYETAKTQFLKHSPNATPPHQKTDNGCVILIDEIDKADSSVPNSLLESMDNNGFHVPQIDMDVKRSTEHPPLVIITTNEERELPAAFLRRCFVLKMEFPDTKDKQLEMLLTRANVHFEEQEVSTSVKSLAAELLLEDRHRASKLRAAKPGVAEYIDTLRALKELYPKSAREQEEALKYVSRFAFDKHPGLDDE